MKLAALLLGVTIAAILVSDVESRHTKDRKHDKKYDSVIPKHVLKKYFQEMWKGLRARGISKTEIYFVHRSSKGKGYIRKLFETVKTKYIKAIANGKHPDEKTMKTTLRKHSKRLAIYIKKYIAAHKDEFAKFKAHTQKFRAKKTRQLKKTRENQKNRKNTNKNKVGGKKPDGGKRWKNYREGKVGGGKKNGDHVRKTGDGKHRTDQTTHHGRNQGHKIGKGHNGHKEHHRHHGKEWHTYHKGHKGHTSKEHGHKGHSGTRGDRWRKWHAEHKGHEGHKGHKRHHHHHSNHGEKKCTCQNEKAEETKQIHDDRTHQTKQGPPRKPTEKAEDTEQIHDDKTPKIKERPAKNYGNKARQWANKSQRKTYAHDTKEDKKEHERVIYQTREYQEAQESEASTKERDQEESPKEISSSDDNENKDGKTNASRDRVGRYRQNGQRKNGGKVSSDVTTTADEEGNPADTTRRGTVSGGRQNAQGAAGTSGSRSKVHGHMNRRRRHRASRAESRMRPFA